MVNTAVVSPFGESTLRCAAFGDMPGLDVSRALAMARVSGRQRWLAAVVLGGQGRYARAASVLVELINDADPVLAALAGCTLAAHRRQLGGHAAAMALDGAALARLADVTVRRWGGRVASRTLTSSANASIDDADVDGADFPGALLDALAGLAADAIGLGRLDTAARLLTRASEIEPVSWRGEVRRCWVGAELALARGRAREAVPLAERAAQLARASANARTRVGGAQALRHTVKSDLVLAASLLAAHPNGPADASNTDAERVRQRATKLLKNVVAVSLKRGIGSLVWPSAALLVNLWPDRSKNWQELTNMSLNCVLTGSDPVGRRLAEASAWVPTGLLHSSDTAEPVGGRNFFTD